MLNDSEIGVEMLKVKRQRRKAGMKDRPWDQFVLDLRKVLGEREHFFFSLEEILSSVNRLGYVKLKAVSDLPIPV
jgi:hypothetical protein